MSGQTLARWQTSFAVEVTSSTFISEADGRCPKVLATFTALPWFEARSACRPLEVDFVNRAKGHGLKLVHRSTTDESGTVTLTATAVSPITGDFVARLVRVMVPVA